MADDGETGHHRRFPNLVSGPAGFGQCLGAVEVEARENPSRLAAMIDQAA
jgi:hypothetical protein